MNRVGGYEAYQNSLYERTKTAKETDAAGAVKSSPTNSLEKGNRMSETAKSDRVILSEDAKNLLKELKKKYGNMNFVIANYETDEEAEQYLSRGTGEYSVLLTPDELEKMAADEDYKRQNLGILDDAISKLDEMKAQLGGKGEAVSRIGIAIDSEGKISYFAELEKVNEKQRERIEKKREKSRDESRVESREKSKRTMVRADSVEALLERIEEVDWSAVKEEEKQLQGHKIDFMA